MADPNARPGRLDAPPVLPVEGDHPRGTLAIVIVFGVLFALAWLSMYVFMFLARGAPQS